STITLSSEPMSVPADDELMRPDDLSRKGRATIGTTAKSRAAAPISVQRPRMLGWRSARRPPMKYPIDSETNTTAMVLAHTTVDAPKNGASSRSDAISPPRLAEPHTSTNTLRNAMDTGFSVGATRSTTGAPEDSTLSSGPIRASYRRALARHRRPAGPRSGGEQRRRVHHGARRKRAVGALRCRRSVGAQRGSCVRRPPLAAQSSRRRVGDPRRRPELRRDCARGRAAGVRRRDRRAPRGLRDRRRARGRPRRLVLLDDRARPADTLRAARSAALGDVGDQLGHARGAGRPRAAPRVPGHAAPPRAALAELTPET